MSTPVDAGNAANRSVEEVIAELDDLIDKHERAQQTRFRSLMAMLALFWVGLILLLALRMMAMM